MIVQDPVQAVLEHLVTAENELGIQIAAFQDGKPVVDARAGIADRTTGRAVDERTLFWASSTAKGITATCAHLLAERGKLDYEQPVAHYWPEFGQNGKAAVTVRHVLSHTAGVPYPPDGVTLKDFVDWDATVAGIAALPLSWEPGSRIGYHNYTFGFIVGEIVRRIDGRPIAAFLQDEICAPLQIDSLFLSVPEHELQRIATRVPDNEFNRRELQMASVPSSGLFCNAQSLAKFYALLALGGTLDGVQLLSPERVRLASQLQSHELDVVYNVTVKRGLGYRLGDDTGPGAGPSALGHVGAGMFGYADPERRLSVAFVKNGFESSDSWHAAETVMAALQRQEGMWG